MLLAPLLPLLLLAGSSPSQAATATRASSAMASGSATGSAGWAHSWETAGASWWGDFGYSLLREPQVKNCPAPRLIRFRVSVSAARAFLFLLTPQVHPVPVTLSLRHSHTSCSLLLKWLLATAGGIFSTKGLQSAQTAHAHSNDACAHCAGQVHRRELLPGVPREVHGARGWATDGPPGPPSAYACHRKQQILV